jgi:hypothetical protein
VAKLSWSACAVAVCTLWLAACGGAGKGAPDAGGVDTAPDVGVAGTGGAAADGGGATTATGGAVGSGGVTATGGAGGTGNLTGGSGGIIGSGGVASGGAGGRGGSVVVGMGSGGATGGHIGGGSGGVTSTGGRPGSGGAAGGGRGGGAGMSGGPGNPGGSGGGGGQPAGSGGAPVTSLACAIPSAGQAEDSSHPTTVVGTGSSSSCTAAALDAAIQKAGVITFNCGADPVTIALTQQIRINNQGGTSQLGDTLIDGGGKVTLSGGGTSRILYLNACEPPYNSDHCDTFEHPHLTVQNLKFTGGNVNDPTDGGGAIFANGGLLKVVNAQFSDNHCATVGQEVKGGAIDTFLQSKPVYIVGSTFSSNGCQSGGAIGSIGTSHTIINSVFTGNQATMGSGGGIANDGDAYTLALCGTVVSGNSATDYGGGVFYVSNAGNGTTTIDSSTVSGNSSTSKNHTGGLYLQGTQAIIRNSTISANSASFAAGVFVFPNAAGNSIDLVNSTVSGNQGTAFEIDATIVGTFVNGTIAGNQQGISGGGLIKLQNTIVASNASGNCSAGHPSGGGNVQFPQTGTACASGVVFADPKLGALGDNGGPTKTMEPGAGSPAIGAGSGCPALDQRGAARPSGGCTSGAVEPP